MASRAPVLPREPRRICLVLLVTVVTSAAISAEVASAQQARRRAAKQAAGRPGATKQGNRWPVQPVPCPRDPAEFLQQMFGPGDPEARQAELAKVEVSAKQEQELGKQAVEHYEQQMAARKAKVLQRGQEVEYVQQLLSELQPLMQQARRYPKIRVSLTDLSEPQAYILPGGHLFLSQGMLREAGSEAALVCVLGHELAHLDRGHLLRRAKQMKLAQQQFTSPDGFSPERMFQSFDTMMQLFRLPFGPQEELEADRDGIAWAYQLGYDPQSIEQLYAKLERPREEGNNLPLAFLRTHPPSAERRENLSVTVAQLQRDRPRRDLYLGVENLRQQVPRSERAFAE
jgi:predicted Zn-dependent protease